MGPILPHPAPAASPFAVREPLRFTVWPSPWQEEP